VTKGDVLLGHDEKATTLRLAEIGEVGAEHLLQQAPLGAAGDHGDELHDATGLRSEAGRPGQHRVTHRGG
jgi:hypothetical protein